MGVGSDVVVTLAGLEVTFRRDTDFVICPRCLSSYRAADLREEPSDRTAT
jgi:hypothetical protein